MQLPGTGRGLGFTYADCLGSCVANSEGAGEELMQACVDLCKSNYPTTTPGMTVPTGQLIKGVSNQTLVLGAAAVVVLMMMTRR